MSTPAQLLIKLPSRQRPVALLEAVQRYAQLCAHPLYTELVISADDDDRTMTPELEKQLQQFAIPVRVYRAPRTTKIGAMNRDIPAEGWDILMAASDDMLPEEQGYDNIIRQDMETWFPMGGGCLWYSDGQQDRVCTLSIMHRTYYKKIGHVYHPEYKSYRCDVEYTERAMLADRMVRIPRTIAKHHHPCWGGLPDDALYMHNRTHKAQDEQTHQRRKAAGYP